MEEEEGKGIGRCVAIFVGGRSGGHNATVIGVAFHHHLPLIATCGVSTLLHLL